MKRLFIAEWLTATGIVVWRQVKVNKSPPTPGQLIATSGLFVMLAILADTGDEQAKVAALFGGGVVLAAFMNLFGAGGPKAATAATGTTQAEIGRASCRERVCLYV